MRAIVAGVNGYLGAHLAQHLVALGEEVTGIGRADRPRVPVSRYVRADLAAPGFWTPDRLDADVIFMFAGATGTLASIDRADEYVLANELTLARLLVALASQEERPRLIFPSTRLVYEGRPEPLDETAPKAFKTVYAINKAACEQIIELFRAHHGIGTTVLRICVPYGNTIDDRHSYGTLGFLLDQARQGRIRLYGGGGQRRTFTHVADVCRLALATATCEATRGETLNVGGEAMSIREVAERIAARFGAVIHDEPWPAREALVESGDTVFDSSRLERLTGLSPRHTVADWLNECAVPQQSPAGSVSSRRGEP